MVDTVKQNRHIYAFSQLFGRKMLIKHLTNPLFLGRGNDSSLYGYGEESRDFERTVLLSLLLCSLLLIF